jgi:hypothetical protein
MARKVIQGRIFYTDGCCGNYVLDAPIELVNRIA